MSRSTAITIYRTIIRWTRKPPACEVPFDVPPSDVQNFLYSLPDGKQFFDKSRIPKNALGKRILADGQGVRDLARLSFEASKTLAKGSEEASQAFDRGFEALRRVHSEYTPILVELREWRARQQDNQGVHFPLGQVVRHKKYKYRGVVCGWDKTCERDASWQIQMGTNLLPNGGNQAFYGVLPDESDCIKLFGAKRDSKYVAQDNMEPVEGDEARITHARLHGMFVGYNVTNERYLPNRTMRYLYHEDYDETDKIEIFPQHFAGESTELNENESDKEHKSDIN
mmetsp:Transcript_32469/g.45028  ORF Transcript_32469/g.45028 Transcript_32469/m.45028 type:complete len:283 (+) Transcript_32469:182-1030(+)|eukprot:CAMPEP_0196588880 /NCGR_PEP_ID=MMETSP1081-20130531/61997_1 /TAXON_ID=36882 /ORGANISM="Pyramimonas amylifera, Strain CCMP720" /LENGTH=282 /DNA_ID=CAMNT_0041911513 /DNA_START=95 /DNA_END=943 /DNA_ORIENTATION=-